ncbi:MAG: metallophosphoesterase [Clostridia bacterium]|nr:metallophosphoesterase [Clostridia bacterium]
MQTIIQRAEFPDERRILMVSDLHGHASGLQELLEKAKYTQDDILVIVGDYIEKGPQNLQTIRYVMELCEAGTVYPLMGNVDIWRLRSLLSDDPVIQRDIVDFSLLSRRWWPSSLLEEMCAECGLVLDEAFDTQKAFPLIREHFASEISFLKSLPSILETQRMIFVHGGIPHEQLDELLSVDPHSLMKWDHFMDEGLSFSKYVTVGHWPVTLYGEQYPCYNPIADRQRRIISLDGGCGVKTDGQLNLIVLPDWRSDEFEHYEWTPLPVITALDDQPETTASGFIHWGDHLVTVLKNNGETSLVLHRGREWTVPSDFLWETNGGTGCNDYTDRRLPVERGDQMYLINEYSFGCYVKKDGMTGWYMGRYQSE